MAMNTVWNRLVREATVGAALFMPRERRRVIERRARGREESENLRRADYVIVSFGKSGRTWLNVMLSRFYQLRFGLASTSLFIFDNLHRKNAAIPRLLFTHDNYLRDFTGAGAGKAAFYDKAVLLLVRHPADVAVSQFFQWRYRMLPRKKALNRYPPHGTELSIFDFVMHHEAGLRRVVTFLNEWAVELPRIRNLLLVRYEDLRAAPQAELRRILRWMGEQPTEAELGDVVAFAAYDNMKKLERQRTFWWSGVRLLPGDAANPDSYKVRRAKIGGYRDYFDDDQVRQIEAYIAAQLDPEIGYRIAAPVEQTVERAV